MNNSESDPGTSGETNESHIDRLSRRIRRKREARDRDERSVWFGLGMFGLVGWSVALPTLLGLLAGVWLDRTFASGRSWTLTLLVAGITLGCFNAWYWVRDASRRNPNENSSETGDNHDH